MEISLNCGPSQTGFASDKIDLRTMKREHSKRKAVTEDRPMCYCAPRESQAVVELMGKGLSRAEISDQLGVSRKRVSVFIERARGKFHLTTALQLRHLAFRLEENRKRFLQ